MEMLNALLVYNIAGDQLFMPFGGGEKREQKGFYRGVREGKIGGLPAQNLLAFVSNANARAHLREVDAQLYTELVELSFNQRDVENCARVRSNRRGSPFTAARSPRADFSQLAQQLGYKPAMRMLEPRAEQVDWATQILHEDDLGFVYRRRKDTKYTQAQKAIARGKLGKVMGWNDLSALGAFLGVQTAATARRHARPG
eukprot:Transcript_23055.p2 GENE.Transcript_23055~~Transcript_23055.p2  ORF type:complete len:199 (+),score=86.26 Transcript_23055:2533-3129(+)